MKALVTSLFILTLGLSVTACSVFGKSDVEVAPYTVVKTDPPFEVRHYDSLVLVTTPMSGLENDQGPFKRLFGFITGDNEGSQKIPMTAPVFMGDTSKDTETMSFVMPKDMKLQDVPKPENEDVNVTEVKNLHVATITFDGRLKRDNINDNKARLNKWIEDNGYEITGEAKVAGYNAPFTLPSFRRNEVLIPIKNQNK